jgi:hypothetical protein
MNKYVYEGPVMYFTDCIRRKWRGETLAVSEAKARSNLAYKWKMQNGYAAGANISLPGKIKLSVDYHEQLRFDI